MYLLSFDRRLFIRFAAVGSLGFMIEAVLLTWFTTLPAVGPILGRGISFPIAVLATWWLNRRLTFRSINNPCRESLRYFGIQILGALTNLVVFILLVFFFSSLHRIPVIPLALAAIAGLVVNFILSKKLVFTSYAER